MSEDILKAEIERLHKVIEVRDRAGKMMLDQLDRVAEQNDRLRFNIKELELKVARDEVDAERYRFIREENFDVNRAPFIARETANSFFGPAWLVGEEADKYVDLAMCQKDTQ
jgi:hypothetical protein